MLCGISRTDLIASAVAAFFPEVNVTPGMTGDERPAGGAGRGRRSLGTARRGLLGQAAARGT
ncbi:MAG TPA: hypothetical protein VGI05_02375 [Streptosporangiaceae bacterium]